MTDASTSERLAELVGGSWRRAEKVPHIHIPTSTARAERESIVILPTGRGCLGSPTIRWTATITAVAVLLVGALAYFLTKDGDESEPERTSPSSSPVGGRPECGANTDDVLLSFSELVKDCQFTQDQLRGGLVYRFERTPFNSVTVDLGTGVGEPVVGGTCKNHNATPQQLQAGADPATGFIGLSLLGVSAAGMKPDGLVRIQVRRPMAWSAPATVASTRRGTPRCRSRSTSPGRTP